MKRKSVSSKQGHLAGEPVSASTLSPAEERLFAEWFSAYHELNIDDGIDSPVGVSAGTMRIRENAARNCVSFFCRRYAGQYSREEVISALAAAVSLPVRFDEWFTAPSSMLLGSAYWLLDYMEQEELYQEFYALLPEEPDEETVFSMPESEDLAHDRTVVLRLAHVLRNRKTASRREFRKLLGLVKKEDAARLRGDFLTALEDYFSRFLEVRTRVKMSDTLPGAETPYSLSPLPDAQRLFDTAPERRPNPLPGKKLLHECPDLLFLLKTPSLIGASGEKIQSELYYRRMTDLLSGYTVRDPYELCAAWLLLERENDLLLQLNILTAAVLICTERLLPWSCEETDVAASVSYDCPDYTPRYLFHPPAPPDDDVRKDDEIPERETTSPAEDETVPNTGNPGEIPDEYKYDWEQETGSEIEENQLLSEQQLFYLATGCLLPRDRIPSERLRGWFERQDVPPERALALAFGACIVSRVQDTRALQDFFSLREEHAPEYPAEQESGQAGETHTDTDSQITELTRRLKASRQALYESEQNVRQLQERLREEETRAMRDRMELNGLRETLFQMKAGESPQNHASEENIAFPWQGRRRILAFGGHDTWSKAIRPLLPGVRFFDRESLPDLNAIKSADVVWIQPNALSHKFYYRIIDTARREEISVQYFGFASARKCAEQLVAYELSCPEE